MQGGDEADAQEALGLFVELAGSDPRFVRKHLAHVVDAMLSVAEHDQLEDGTRQLATEFLVTLTGRGSRARHDAQVAEFRPAALRLSVRFLLDVEDDPEWHTCDKEEDGDAGEGERYEVGQECLDRVAIALGANSVLPCAARTVPALLADASDWRKRHAALVAMAQIAEGCVKGMLKDVNGAIAPCVQAATSDPHARVRWAAVNGIGQLCTDLGPKMQEKAHAQVLPALLGAMEDPRTGSRRTRRRRWCTPPSSVRPSTWRRIWTSS